MYEVARSRKGQREQNRTEQNRTEARGFIGLYNHLVDSSQVDYANATLSLCFPSFFLVSLFSCIARNSRGPLSRAK